MRTRRQHERQDTLVSHAEPHARHKKCSLGVAPRGPLGWSSVQARPWPGPRPHALPLVAPMGLLGGARARPMVQALRAKARAKASRFLEAPLLAVARLFGAPWAHSGCGPRWEPPGYSLAPWHVSIERCLWLPWLLLWSTAARPRTVPSRCRRPHVQRSG